MAWCTDVLTDKPHPRFDTKILSKKVRLICRCLRYLLLAMFAYPVKAFKVFMKLNSSLCSSAHSRALNFSLWITEVLALELQVLLVDSRYNETKTLTAAKLTSVFVLSRAI